MFFVFFNYFPFFLTLFRRYATMTPLLLAIKEKIFESFSDLCTELKPIIDVHLISYLGKQNPVKLLCNRFLDELLSLSRSIGHCSSYFIGGVDIYDSTLSQGDSKLNESLTTDISTDKDKELLIIKQLVITSCFKAVAGCVINRFDVILRETDFDSTLLRSVLSHTSSISLSLTLSLSPIFSISLILLYFLISPFTVLRRKKK